MLWMASTMHFLQEVVGRDPKEENDRIEESTEESVMWHGRIDAWVDKELLCYTRKKLIWQTPSELHAYTYGGMLQLEAYHWDYWTIWGTLPRERIKSLWM